MFFEARIYSKQYDHILPRRFRKNDLKSSKENEKRIFNNFKKEKINLCFFSWYCLNNEKFFVLRSKNEYHFRKNL